MTMTLSDFISQLNTHPERIQFTETMAVIADYYTFTETAFNNGKQSNLAGENSGSCKLFSFAQINGLTETQTLSCFGHYYREDVLSHPDGNDHQNIRQFMLTGWGGVKFESAALSEK